MKQTFTITLFSLLFFFIAVPAEAAVNSVRPVDKEAVEKEVEKAKEEWKSMTRKERRAKKKEIRKEFKSLKKEMKRGNASDDLLLLVIVTILIPPLGMFLYEGGLTDRFWISLLLTLLFYVPGLIYTLVIILGGR